MALTNDIKSKLLDADYLHPCVLLHFGWSKEKIAEELDISHSSITAYVAQSNPCSRAKRKTLPPKGRWCEAAIVVRKLVAEGIMPKSPIPQTYLEYKSQIR